MTDLRHLFPSARQVRLGDVITGWMEAGGFSVPATPAMVPATAKSRYERWVEKGDLFLRFIPHCDWFEVEFDPSWVHRIQLIAEESWRHEEAQGERVLAKRTDLKALPPTHRKRVDALRTLPALGPLLHRKTVLFGHGPAEPWTILDGNHRLLALACRLLVEKRSEEPFSVFVGLSYGPCRWHGDPVVWQERPERVAGERRYVLKVW